METDRKAMRVLVLDGGGVRGIHTHILLQRVIREPNVVFPDLLVGVSVGAMVGALLAFNITLPIEELIAYIPRLFDHRTSNGPLMAPKYDGIGKRNVLQEIFGSRKLGDAAFDFAVAVSDLQGRVKLLTSWEHPYLLVTDVLDATSAAPVFYPPVRVESTWYIDGGTVANTPLILSYLAAMERGNAQHPISMMSMGTRPPSISNDSFHMLQPQHMGAVAWLNHGLLDLMAGVGDDTQERYMRQLLGRQFNRLTCPMRARLDDIDSISGLRGVADLDWYRHRSRLLKFFQI